MPYVLEKGDFRIELEEKGDLVKCPKCGRASWRPYLTSRTGKNPEGGPFFYWEFRHRKDGRTGKNKHCYWRATKGQPAEKPGPA